MKTLFGAFISQLLAVVDVGFDTDERLYAFIFHRFIKVYSAEHIAVIGDGCGFDALFF